MYNSVPEPPHDAAANPSSFPTFTTPARPDYFFHSTYTPLPARPPPWVTDPSLTQLHPILTPYNNALSLRHTRSSKLSSLPIPLSQKLSLRSALGYRNWPTRFQSLENAKAPSPEHDEYANDTWSDADERALWVIGTCCPDFVGVVGMVFFPWRLEEEVLAKWEEMRGESGIGQGVGDDRDGGVDRDDGEEQHDGESREESEARNDGGIQNDDENQSDEEHRRALEPVVEFLRMLE
jgi:hypothetical protein